MSAAARLLLCFLAATTAARAASPASIESNVPATGFLQVVVALGLVLAAIAAFAWFLRRISPGAMGGRGWVRVVGGVMVGPKERVVLVEVGETWLLLGVAASSVNVLHTLPKPPQTTATESEAMPAGFAGALREAMVRRRRKP